MFSGFRFGAVIAGGAFTLLFWFLPEPFQASEVEQALPDASAGETAQNKTIQNGVKSIDAIIEKMAKARSREQAGDLEEQLLLAFEQSEDATAELLLEWARRSLELEDYASALELANRVEKNFPDMAAPLYYQSLALNGLGHYTRVFGKIVELIGKEPRFVHAYQLLAGLMVEFDRRDLAIVALRKGLEINPKSNNLLDFLKHVRNGFERST